MLGFFKRRNRKLTRELLASYSELAGLAPAHLDAIINKQRVTRHRKGSCLFREMDSARRIFLLDGAVRLALSDGSTRRVEAAQRVALNPGDEAIDSAHAETAAQTFEVPASLLRRTALPVDRASAEQTGIVVEELSHDDDGGKEGQLVYRIYNDSLNARLSLPSLPELAVSVSRAVNSPDSTTQQVARLIQADVSITARLVQIANGPLYRGEQVIQTCHDAVTRMGLRATQDTVRSLSLRQMFKSDDPRLSERLRQLWRHSTRVAAVSAVIAKMVPGMDPERAMLAGLMHDVGVLVIVNYMNDLGSNEYSEEELEEVISRLRGEIGATVLRKWNFDDDLIRVALEVEDYTRDSVNGPDYCDIVSVAQIHCFFGTPQIRKCPPLLEIPAFLKLPLREIGPEKSIESLRDAQADINEVLAMLEF